MPPPDVEPQRPDPGPDPDPDQAPTPDGQASRDGPAPVTPRSQAMALTGTRLKLEIGVVLLLAVLPDLYNAILPLLDPAFGESWPSFELSAGSLIMRSLMVVAPVLYIVHLNGEGVASVGIRRPRYVVDVALGAVVYTVGAAMYWTVAWVVYAGAEAGLIPDTWFVQYGTTDEPRVSALWPLWLLAMAGANAFAEELVMRGYLLPRLERLFGNATLAIVITSVLFASYHVYQGVYGLISALTFGLVAGAVFVLTRRLWPCFVAHAIGDVLPYLWS